VLNTPIFKPDQITFKLFNILIKGRHYALHFRLNAEFGSTVKIV
jgi:hypothetical protein